MYGVTRQYDSWIKKTYGGYRSPREIVLDEFPWSASTLQSSTSAYRRLRDHGEYMATSGDGMSNDKLRRLRAFYRKLREEGLVLEFDPSIPPIRGLAVHGGFAYRERTESDGDLLIRVNEHTRLTDAGRRIWCFPEVEP